MPFGPGTYGPGQAKAGAAALAAPAVAQQGIPEAAVLPTGSPEGPALSELLRMIRGGQVGAEKVLELLSLLAVSTVPQMDQAPPSMSGPGDIAGLLGG